MTAPMMRPLTGLATVAVLATIVLTCATMFQGGFTDTVPLTVLSQRAGLVMNPDAKVRLLGVDIGHVASIEQLPNGQAAIHLAVDPAKLRQIPSNTRVDISSNTVFGAKSIDFVPPQESSSRVLRPGQVLDADHVTVEFNTIFQQLVAVLTKIQPDKLNATLRAISSAFSGRGHQIGQTFGDLDELLARLEPGLPNLSRDIEMAPAVLNSYADAAPDLLQTIQNTTQLSNTVVDQQSQLEELLLSVIGLANTGNDVLGANTNALSDVVHSAGTDDRSDQPVQPRVAVWARQALRDEHHPAATGGRRVVVVRPPIWPRALPVSGQLAEGRGYRRTTMHRPTESADGGKSPTGGG